MIVQGQLGDEMISVALLPSLASLVGHRVLYSTADEGSLEVTSLNITVSRELNSTTTANCNCGSQFYPPDCSTTITKGDS